MVVKNPNCKAHGHPENKDCICKQRVFCTEHELELNPDGTCPKCRDENGEPFILDMQSIYLKQ